MNINIREANLRLQIHSTPHNYGILPAVSVVPNRVAARHEAIKITIGPRRAERHPGRVVQAMIDAGGHVLIVPQDLRRTLALFEHIAIANGVGCEECVA